MTPDTRALISSLEDQLAWSIKNEAQYKAALSEAFTERDRYKAALDWCIDGLEGTYGAAFWDSPLGIRLYKALQPSPPSEKKPS